MKPILSIVLLHCLCMFSPSSAADVSGTMQQWHTVTLGWTGPDGDEDASESVFADTKLTVTMSHASGVVLSVPGFFAADGQAAESSASAGNRWCVRFTPPLVGRWRYDAVMVRGKDAAIDEPVRDLETIPLDGASGYFDVAASEASRPDFRGEGHLRHVGRRYLQFAGSKRYFLKAGVNSPETLLGFADFDGTWHDQRSHPIAAPHPIIALPSLDAGLHHFKDHVGDWIDGDPTWKQGRGKGLIGAANYLSGRGVNSVYFLTMNVNGDGRNVWPWTDPWEHDRFDCSKLDQWEIVFSHFQSKGIVLHVVLQETENDHLLDHGSLGRSRKLYLREMVARFAHHPALIWNLGEENTQTIEQQSQMSAYLRNLDPYDHPITIHNDHWSTKNLRETFDPLLGRGVIDGTSIQDFHWNDVHATVKHYVDASARSGSPWFVCTDEIGGANFGLVPDAEDPDHNEARNKGLWGNLMAGGAGVEWYFGWQNNSPNSDLSAETWRSRQTMYDQSRHAIDFFQRYLPFEEMSAADHLPLAYADYGFAKSGEVYCVYLFSGGNTRLNLEHHAGPFVIDWFDPRRGGELQRGSVSHVWGPGLVAIGDPPASINGKTNDAVALIRRVDPVFTARQADQPVVVEAEHFSRQRNDDVRRWHVLEKGGELPELEGTGEPTTWTRSNLSASASASGRTFVRCLPDTRTTHDDALIPGTNFSPEPGKMAILDYEVELDRPGRYYVWVRAFSTGSEDNGLHVGLDGQWPQSGQRMQWCNGKNKWTWNCAQRTEKEHCGVLMQIHLQVDQPGRHTVSFSMREDGFAMDQFLLTDDPDYRPQGELNGEAIKRPSETNAMQFPGTAWSKVDPAVVGVDPRKLNEALQYLRSHCKADGLSELMLVRNGHVFHQGGNTKKVHDIWSCTKSFTSTALGLLIADEVCSLDTKAADIEPSLKEHYPDVTLRHFATMTSGYSAKGRSRWQDENADWSWTPYTPEPPLFQPGKGFAYWDEAMMMFGRVLTRIAGENINDFMNRRVYQKIGMGKVTWSSEGLVDGIEIANGCTGVKVNAEQLARFGHLFLNHGVWNGTQIVPSNWVREATMTQVPETVPVADTDRSNVLGSGSYGFNWWTAGGASGMPEVPPKTYYASGLNHNVLAVVPEWGIVIVRMGVDGNPDLAKHEVYNTFIAKLGEAMMDNEPSQGTRN